MHQFDCYSIELTTCRSISQSNFWGISSNFPFYFPSNKSPPSTKTARDRGKRPIWEETRNTKKQKIKNRQKHFGMLFPTRGTDVESLLHRLNKKAFRLRCFFTKTYSLVIALSPDCMNFVGNGWMIYHNWKPEHCTGKPYGSSRVLLKNWREFTLLCHTKQTERRG